MKKITKKIYQMISSVALTVAVLSVTELNTFCILIIHQPDIPERLRKKVGILQEEKNESINLGTYYQSISK